MSGLSFQLFKLRNPVLLGIFLWVAPKQRLRLDVTEALAGKMNHVKI